MEDGGALVSIIVPAYNAEATLDECLKACLDQSYGNTEVIIVDDGSTDGTAKIAQSYELRYLRQQNAGPAAARNCGAKEARGDIIAYTDSDCAAAKDWIERLVEGFEDGVVAVGGTYGIANESSLLATMIHHEIEARHQGFGEEVDFLGSFNVAYRKAEFEAAGGFDETFRDASGEDNDLAYRLADQGGALRFQRSAVVVHYHPDSLWPYLRTQMAHGYWRMKLYAKHPKRSGGDKYAGSFDFLAPPLSLATFGCAALSYVTQTPALAILASVLFVALVLIHLIPTMHMVHRAKDMRLWLFIYVAILRDVARSLGMVRGIWTFMIQRRASD